MPSLALQQFSSPGLQPFDLNLETGQCIALSGPSGCGKTRLLRAIADLDPNSGQIHLNGTPRDQLSPTEWRSRVGYLPAESHWWQTQVRDHFDTEKDTSQLEPLFQALGFTLDTLTWEIARLSSGERQRLALIRLLSGEPEILLLDEPTANLDRTNIEKVEALLERYRKDHNRGMLWVSHDPEQRRRVAQRALHFEKGKLMESQWS